MKETKISTAKFLEAMLVYYMSDRSVTLKESELENMCKEIAKLEKYDNDKFKMQAEFWLIVEKWFTPRQCKAFSKYAINILNNPDVLLKK